jgi:ABC-type arginine/histidine transport system permease subunit
LSPMERIFCQHHLPGLIAQLALLRRNWIVTVLLAILLALAVVAHAEPMIHDSIRMGILVTVLSSILLPPMVIYHGIARDYVAAQSLLAAIRAPAR